MHNKRNTNISHAHQEWRNTILNHFPKLLEPAKIAVTAANHLNCNDATKPLAIVFIGDPSAGKTTLLSFLYGHEHTYKSDEFTQASFVSCMPGLSEEQLSKTDLLPRLHNKNFVIADLASAFAKKPEDLQITLGTLTRVLDGNGYHRDSGVTGSRGYDDIYFNLLSATTHLRGFVWDIMNNLGSRIFFYYLKSPDVTIDDLVNEANSTPYEKKVSECSAATCLLLDTIAEEYPDGYDWEHDTDAEDLLQDIARCALLLSKLRSSVSHAQDKKELSEGSSTEYITESPSRINQLLCKYARSHALMEGRLYLDKSDVTAVMMLAINSAPPNRVAFVKAVIENGGTADKHQIKQFFNKSDDTIHRLASELGSLGIVKYSMELCGNHARGYSLSEEFISLAKYGEQFVAQKIDPISK